MTAGTVGKKRDGLSAGILPVISPLQPRRFVVIAFCGLARSRPLFSPLKSRNK